jgi:hypothetical protein
LEAFEAENKEDVPHIEHMKKNESNIAELFECIKLVWAAITIEEINNLVKSLPRRIEACIHARSWYTKY